MIGKERSSHDSHVAAFEKKFAQHGLETAKNGRESKLCFLAEREWNAQNANNFKSIVVKYSLLKITNTEHGRQNVTR